MTLLTVDDVRVEFKSKSRGVVRAVDGASLTVAAGEVVGLVGESGCGKSSLARAVVGLQPVTSGAVKLHDREVQPVKWRPIPARQTRLQMVFQDPNSSLNPRRTIGAQLADGVESQLHGEQRDARVRELLEMVGLPADTAKRYPHQFSGGQRQRVAIARALAARPEVIVADEPVTALDASAQAQIITLLMGLVSELNLGMLFISHDLSLVHEIADRTAVMYLGRIVESAETRTLMTRPTHPYTQALIKAIPHVGAERVLPEPLAGEVPDGANIPEGCAFRPRCPYATEKCLTRPEIRPVGNALVACWHAESILERAGIRITAPGKTQPTTGDPRVTTSTESG